MNMSLVATAAVGGVGSGGGGNSSRRCRRVTSASRARSDSRVACASRVRSAIIIRVMRTNRMISIVCTCSHCSYD